MDDGSPILTKRPRAARLDPDARREMILDTAAGLVIQQGISSCSLEAVATATGVSKALVYKYFANREALLAALLRREMHQIRGQDTEATDGAREAVEAATYDIDDILRVEVARYIDYLVERGGLFRALVSDPGLASHIQEDLKAGAGVNMAFWTGRTMASYGLPYDLTRIGVIMTSRALEGAQGSVRAGKIDTRRLAEFWATFVQAGWKAVGEKYGTGKGGAKGRA